MQARPDIRHEIERRYRIVFFPETFNELMDTLKGGDWYNLIQRAWDRSELFRSGVSRGRYVITFDLCVIEVPQEASKKTCREWLKKAVTGG